MTPHEIPDHGRRAMGELEHDVLRSVWASPIGVTPTEALDALHQPLAYTTVLTVLTRLWHKGIVRRSREGKSYRYVATKSEAEWAADKMRDALNSATDRQQVMTRFVRSLDAREASTLRALFDESAGQ